MNIAVYRKSSVALERVALLVGRNRSVYVRRSCNTLTACIKRYSRNFCMKKTSPRSHSQPHGPSSVSHHYTTCEGSNAPKYLAQFHIIIKFFAY
jgi:hypothetical protein